MRRPKHLPHLTEQDIDRAERAAELLDTDEMFFRPSLRTSAGRDACPPFLHEIMHREESDKPRRSW